jgi:hypothetical protein
VLLKGKCEKKRRRLEAGGTNGKFKRACRMPALQEEKADRRKGEGSCMGRYVYDRGAADLICGLGGSDYDVRSLRRTLACLGCVLGAAMVEFSYRSTWWF